MTSLELKISPGNSKMGAIPSVSLPAGVTCRKDLPCYTSCYARKLERIRPTVRAAYQSNLELYKRDPDTYWREVEGQIMLSRFFRFHVSGDIPDEIYFAHMLDIARRNPHCQILCFTKQFAYVNRYLQAGVRIPENLHVIFSAWRGLQMENPYNLPEAHVIHRDGSDKPTAGAEICAGNCTECALTDGGCWNLKNGGRVYFHEH